MTHTSGLTNNFGNNEEAIKSSVKIALKQTSFTLENTSDDDDPPPPPELEDSQKHGLFASPKPSDDIF